MDLRNRPLQNYRLKKKVDVSSSLTGRSKEEVKHETRKCMILKHPLATYRKLTR